MLKWTIPGAIATLVMFFISLFRFIRWKIISVPGVGTVGELAEVQFDTYKDERTATKYIYHLQIATGSKVFSSTVCNRVPFGKPPTLLPGHQFNVLVNPKNGKYKNAKEIKSSIWKNAIWTFIFLGVSVLPLVIALVIELFI